MKKKLLLWFSLLFLLSSNVLFASDTSSQQLQNCWGCNILEGIYVYVFNFVYKLYDKFVPILQKILIIAMAFWFIWYIWTNAIKEQKGNTFSFLKEVFVKLLAYTFVLSFLSLPAKEIFSYTIDPIMNMGPNFAKWVLTEARADTELFNVSTDSFLGGFKVQNFSCDDVKLSSYATKVLNHYQKTNLSVDEMSANEETLRNLMCITREYENTYNAGSQLGLKIMARAGIGMGEFKLLDFVYNTTAVQTIENLVLSKLGGWGILYTIIMFFIKIYLVITFLANVLTFFIGLCIAVAFLYIAFTYLLILLDIVVKLAMVGVMMPITIGAWTFKNTRGQLSKPLFFNVVQCTFRIAFLSVAMTISTYLLNELLTTNFNAGPFDITLKSLLDSLGNDGKIVTASSIFNGVNLFSDTNQILATILLNPTIIISSMFVCLISYYLLSESNSMAGKFSSAIGSGVGEDTILNGLKNITISTIRYVKNGVSREANSYLKSEALKDKFNNEFEAKRKLKEKQRNNEDITVFDIPIDEAVDLYENGKNLDDSEFAPETDNEGSYKTKSTDKVKKEYEERSKKYNETRQRQNEKIDTALEKYESYKQLDDTEKTMLQDIVLSDDYMENQDLVNNNEHLKEVVNDVKNDSQNPQNDNPFAKVKSDIFKQEMESYIRNSDTIGRNQKRALIKYINQGGKIIPEHRKLLNEVEAEVKSKNYKEQKRLEGMKSYVAFRENLQKYHKNEINAKDLYLILKNNEVESLTSEIENEMNKDVIFMDRRKLAMLNKKLRKIRKDFESIDEYDSDTIEDFVQQEIKNYKKRKSKQKAPKLEALNKKES